MEKHKKEPIEITPDDVETGRLNAEDVDETQQSIEEAAYYIGLNRRNYSQPGDELSDWLEAEKKIKEDLD
jgi:hypothetical protein